MDDYDGLLDLIGTRRVALIGEASHGTHDFSRERARITRRLIDECGFDPSEAEHARERYACFDHVGGNGQRYGYALAYEGALPCENEAVAQLVELRARGEAHRRRDGWLIEDELFFAEQNARVVRDAEEYYQQMYRAEVSSWNLRDRHMAATLDAVIDHLERRFGPAKGRRVGAQLARR